MYLTLFLIVGSLLGSCCSHSVEDFPVTTTVNSTDGPENLTTSTLPLTILPTNSTTPIDLNDERPAQPPSEIVDGIEMQYVCNPVPEPCPQLKSYKTYQLTPEDDFYPCWSYFGFHPPSEWKDVDINFFDPPPLPNLEPEENDNVRRHGSAMHLCTKDVTTNITGCKKLMTNQCTNDMPSPINIIRKEAKVDKTLEHLEFVNYEVSFGFEMFFETDGTQLLFIKLIPKSHQNLRPSLIKGPLKSGVELQLDRIVVRVGTELNKGSEHAIDSKHFGMEFQFFFTADELPYWQILSRYKLMPENDSRIGSQLHVVSMFAQVLDSDEAPPPGSDFMGEEMEALSLVAERFWGGVNLGSFSKLRVTQNVFSLEELLRVPMSGPYYTYYGSLSHPPCLTHVPWSILEKPNYIKYHQWRRFTLAHVEYSDLQTLGGNIRPMGSIQFKVDLALLAQMKNIENRGELTQYELDEATQNAKIDRLQIHSDKALKFLPNLFLVRPYIQYQTYFARRVRKSTTGRHPSGNEYEYYDSQNADKRSGHRGSMASSSLSLSKRLLVLHVITTFGIKLF